MLRGMPEYNGAAPLQRTPIGVPWWQPDDRRKEEEMIFEKNLAWQAASRGKRRYLPIKKLHVQKQLNRSADDRHWQLVASCNPKPPVLRAARRTGPAKWSANIFQYFIIF